MGTSLENDITCLLESLHYLGNDVDQTIQALEHLSEMALQDHGANIMNHTGAFSMIFKLLFNPSTDGAVIQKALILLGNASLRSHDIKGVLCNDQLMNLLKTKILNDVHNNKMIASGSYFLSCLCSSSERMQNKIRKGKLLDRLVVLYRTFHPKGSTHSNQSKEQWFEKASSNSPAILTHISHALKSIINKPKNADNQVVCSILLNLALQTIGASTESSSSKIEGLQFVADCLYENNKTQKIFNMIGGIRVLIQKMKKEISKCVLPAKLPILNSLLDTMIVAVTDHDQNKETAMQHGLIETVTDCLRREGSDSLHLKCMMCLSELVHENVACQKKTVACNTIPEIVNVMSQKQDDMLSKIGTSILQNCIQYQDDLDGCQPNRLGSAEETPSTNPNVKPSIFKSLLETLGDSAVPEFLSSFVKKGEEPDSTKKSSKNLRRAKRCLLKSDNKENKELKDKDEMMGMLKSQNELLRKFQDEIKHLRAEVRSQTASDYGDVIQHNMDRFPVPMTPSRNSHQNHFTTPSKRLYQNVAARTTRTRSSVFWTPQQSWKRSSRVVRCIVDEQPHRLQQKISLDCETPSCFNEDNEMLDHDLNTDDDERPALCKASNEEISTPIALHRKSLYDKVHQWQKESVPCVPTLSTESIRTPINSKNHKTVVNTKTPFIRPRFATPTSHPKPYEHLQYAPKKKESTKRRCPTTSDEGFHDDSQQTSEMVDDSYSGIRRMLSFEKAKDVELQPIREVDEQRAPTLTNDKTINSQCYGCNPILQEMNSRNLLKVMSKNQQFCKHHASLVRKIQIGYNRGKFFCKPTAFHPKEKKDHGRRKPRNWESMSVFSYKSEVSHKSRNSHISMYSGYTMMTTSNRRQRKDYSHEEVNYIIEGVERFGRRWKMILEAFPFKSGRTAVDLKDKYKKLKFVDSNCKRGVPLPFTTQELVNLKRGVLKFGEQWPNILNGFQFESSRTSNELQEKWERLMKRSYV